MPAAMLFHVAAQFLLAAHDADLGGLTDLHALQLGFLEVAVHMEGMGVEHGEHLLAGGHVVARSQGQVAEVAVHWRDDLRAGQVEGGQIAVGDGLGELASPSSTFSRLCSTASWATRPDSWALRRASRRAWSRLARTVATASACLTARR
jgi:hypothetical protein